PTLGERVKFPMAPALLFCHDRLPAGERYENGNESTSLRDIAPSKLPFQPPSHRRSGACGIRFRGFHGRERTALVVDAAHRPNRWRKLALPVTVRLCGESASGESRSVDGTGVSQPPGYRNSHFRGRRECQLSRGGAGETGVVEKSIRAF